jgi:hypothetical protein
MTIIKKRTCKADNRLPSRCHIREYFVNTCWSAKSDSGHVELTSHFSWSTRVMVEPVKGLFHHTLSSFLN